MRATGGNAGSRSAVCPADRQGDQEYDRRRRQAQPQFGAGELGTGAADRKPQRRPPQPGIEQESRDEDVPEPGLIDVHRRQGVPREKLRQQAALASDRDVRKCREGQRCGSGHADRRCDGRAGVPGTPAGAIDVARDPRRGQGDRQQEPESRGADTQLAKRERHGKQRPSGERPLSPDEHDPVQR